jgi:parvulin-like peptidyl-prolyl isomerase
MRRAISSRFWVVALVAAVAPVACKTNDTASDDRVLSMNPNNTVEASTTATAKLTPSATGPVAKVNGIEISRSDFDKRLDMLRGRFHRSPTTPALDQILKENLIRDMIQEELIAQKAKAEGVAVDSAEVDARMDKERRGYVSDEVFDNEFAKFLVRTNQTENGFKDSLKKELLREKLIAKIFSVAEPTEANAQKQYEEKKHAYRLRETIEASHILIKMDKETLESDRKKKLAQATKIVADAKKPGASFEELAKVSSESPNKASGGYLGSFSHGDMEKPFEDAAFAANAGDVIGPVETTTGYHIIRVLQKSPEVQLTFNEVRGSILWMLAGRLMSKDHDMIDKLKTDAKIEVLEPGISVDPARSVAKVNGVEISRSDFEKRFRARFHRLPNTAFEQLAKENLIRDMIEEELIAQKAKAEGVAVDGAELDEKVAEHKRRVGKKAFADYLELHSQSEGDFMHEWEQDLLRTKLFAQYSLRKLKADAKIEVLEPGVILDSVKPAMPLRPSGILNDGNEPPPVPATKPVVPASPRTP